MATMNDTMMPVASQEYAARILVAPVIAWGIQMILGSCATVFAWPHLVRRKSKGATSKTKDNNKKAASTIPHARVLLAMATLANTLSVLVCWWEFADFSVRQDRSSTRLSMSRPCRSIAPLPIAATAAFTQAFMALRCWRLANRSIMFGIVASVLVLSSLTGGVGFSILLLRGRVLNNWAALVFPQLLTWASLAVDSLITGVLVYHLSKKKQDGLPPRAEHMLDDLIRLAFETCAMPWFVILVSSIFGAIAFRDPDYTRPIYWALNAITPSLHLFSFVYCLEATMHRIVPQMQSPDPPSFVEPGFGQQGSPTGCLCAYIKPFTSIQETEKEGSSNSEGKITEAISQWDPPAVWESFGREMIENAVPRRQGRGWQSASSILSPKDARIRSNGVYTAPVLPYQRNVDRVFLDVGMSSH